MTTLDDLSQLADRISAEVADAIRLPRLEAVRQALNETGIRRARVAVLAAPQRIAEAAADLRNAQEAERDAKRRLDDEILAAEWELDGRFVRESNRTYLVDPKTDERRQMTADEVRTWKAAEAAKQPAVEAAATAVRTAEHATAAARDALATAERHFSAARADLTAAVAELTALGIGIAAEPANHLTNHHTGGNHR